MFAITSLFLIASFVRGQANSSLEFLPNVPISIESAPWQVSIRLKAIDLEFYGDGHLCGGTVISQRVILTAAHCVVNEELAYELQGVLQVTYRQPEEFTIVMGTDSLIHNTPFTLQFDVAQLVVHEAFNFKTLVNNVAMFLITDFIPWDWPTVEAIPLNINSEVNGVICTTTGWNLTEDNASSSILRESIVPITNRSFCQEFYGDLTSDLLCAGFRENSPHAFCEGDTGGPLVCSGYLTGIILEGNSCAETGFLGLYVNVLYHYNWIIAKNKTFDYGHVVPIYDDISLDYYNSNDDARQTKNLGNVSDDPPKGYAVSKGNQIAHSCITIIYCLVYLILY